MNKYDMLKSETVLFGFKNYTLTPEARLNSMSLATDERYGSLRYRSARLHG